MVKSEKTPFGYIYRAINKENRKNYLGQTVKSRWGDNKKPIEERWKEEIREAYAKQRRGEDLRYIENAIIKYGPENFDLKKEDTAYSQEELDKKETDYIKQYDSMNPDKGYNLKEGGRGGRLSEMAKEKLSKIGIEKWRNDLAYQRKQLNERRERAKDPEFIDKMNNLNKDRGKSQRFREKMTKINQEKAKDPEWREKMSKVGKEKWKNDLEYQKKQINERRERAKDPEWREKMTRINREITSKPEYKEKMSNSITKIWQDPVYKQKQIDSHDKYKKKIEDKRQFLEDIQNMQKKDIAEKYNMDGKTVNRRIEEMLGEKGVKNYTEAKDYLRDKDINDVLKDIEKRETEEQGEKSETEKDSENSGEKTREENPEEKNHPSGETDKESSDSRDSKQEKDDEIADKEQEEEAEGEKGKTIEEEKVEGSDVSSKGQVDEPKDPSISASTDEPTDQQGSQTENYSDNFSSKPLEMPPYGINLRPFDPAEQEKKKSEDLPTFGQSSDKNRGSAKLTSGAGYDEFGNKISPDYEGIDQSQTDKGEDFKGIDEYADKPNKDYKILGEIIAEKGSDFDGIDNPQENGDKDYDDIDEGYPEGNVESGGGP